MLKLLDGRVAVITGSGRGLGRAYALAMASQGAKVVVNDIGGAPNGAGSSKAPADEVVEEIVRAGGVAIANYDSVSSSEGASSIIETAKNNFGRLDILVNNAGILTDKMIFTMSDEDWDRVIKVHLYGTFYCVRNACRLMREQKYGRIINISSGAGLGSVGQANYSAAKEGIVGLSRTVAKDMASYGVTCNVVRPRAATRLTITDELYGARKRSLGAEKAEEWKRVLESRKPEDISPLLVFLASEKASYVSGCVFDASQNYIALYHDPPSFEKIIEKKGSSWLAEELAEVMPKTLALGLKPLTPTAIRRLTPQARAWELADGVLRETEAVAR